jgi:CRISPR-associated exonuclease Cas4
VLGDGTRHKVENTEALRAWVLDLAEQIRATRKVVTIPIAINPTVGQCRGCGQRGNCGQAKT